METALPKYPLPDDRTWRLPLERRRAVRQATRKNLREFMKMASASAIARAIAYRPLGTRSRWTSMRPWLTSAHRKELSNRKNDACGGGIIDYACSCHTLFLRSATRSVTQQTRSCRLRFSVVTRTPYSRQRKRKSSRDGGKGAVVVLIHGPRRTANPGPSGRRSHEGSHRCGADFRGIGSSKPEAGYDERRRQDIRAVVTGLGYDKPSL